ncbi:sulfite oxidase-like oxidoreductase [Govanella unica]|uniref:Sulfite oxidase-like oxidoreductase n=1 Tax=Govanella unica TaxID=2975056 RepID=A0A9X3TYD9_9PROT|nr:sulfite oxidase-like oxidoreductase [Govania unica]MDA5194256.1 sulfite oxidase-like oxidoreductase [Govania unica]
MADEDKITGTGQIKDKLIRTKEAWAREGRLLTGSVGDPTRDRLPPGQREVKDWPVLDMGYQPTIPNHLWRLTIDGLVTTPLTWTHADFMAQPQVDLVTDIHCVTQWSRYDNHWNGITSAHVLALVQPKPAAKHVIFHSYDGYTTNVALDVFAAPDVLLAHSWEGAPLTKEHGGPVRIMIPRFYFWKSAKWIKRIEFSAEDKPGFWEVRGYHNTADPWKEDRYSGPEAPEPIFPNPDI